MFVGGSYRGEHRSWSNHGNQESKMGPLLAGDTVGGREGNGEYEWISSPPPQDQPHSLSHTPAAELCSDALLFTRDKGSVLAMSLKDTLTLR